MLYDAFICHASEDKDEFVRPLAHELRNHHLEVWYDEFTLEIGDSLRETIDRGLAQSQFGVVVLSPNFFRKGWARRELNGLVSREIAEERRLILPIWHNINAEGVAKYSPILADIKAIPSLEGVGPVARALSRRLRLDESPLIAARNELMRQGITPPIISDEWWLGIIEAKEAELNSPFADSRRWLFPLPYEGYVEGRERGLNIAWTALQLDWSDAAEERQICQITRPEVVLEFVEEFPGLGENCHKYPDILACHAPQLTIPGFGGEFEGDFDDFLQVSVQKFSEGAADYFERRKGQGVDGGNPVCAREIALHHGNFANYTAAKICKQYFGGHHNYGYQTPYSNFDHVVWLLSEHSAWLPEPTRRYLVNGMNENPIWSRSHELFDDLENEFVDRMLQARNYKTFKPTKRIRGALIELIGKSLENMRLSGGEKEIAAAFFQRGIIEAHFDFNERRRQSRAEKFRGRTSSRSIDAKT